MAWVAVDGTFREVACDDDQNKNSEFARSCARSQTLLEQEETAISSTPLQAAHSCSKLHRTVTVRRACQRHGMMKSKDAMRTLMHRSNKAQHYGYNRAKFKKTALHRSCFSRGRFGGIRRPCSGVAFAGRCTPPLLHEDDHHAHVGKASHLADFSAVACRNCHLRFGHTFSQMCAVRCDMRMRCSSNAHTLFASKTARGPDAKTRGE